MKKSYDERLKQFFRRYSEFIFLLTITIGITSNVMAAEDPLTVVNNLSSFIFGLIRAVGMIMCGWGIVQFGLSLKSHDPSQRANSLLTILGAIIITFSKEILDYITK